MSPLRKQRCSPISSDFCPDFISSRAMPTCTQHSCGEEEQEAWSRVGLISCLGLCVLILMTRDSRYSGPP